MEPTELAQEVANVLMRAVNRVGPDSIGAQQYHTTGQPQKFETITLEELKEMYLEEFEDIINYAVMAHIRVRQLFEDLENLDALRNHQSNTDAGVQRGDFIPSGAASFIPASKVSGVPQDGE